MVTGSSEEWIGTIIGVFVLLVLTWAAISAALAGVAYVVIAGLGAAFGFGAPDFLVLLAVSGVAVFALGAGAR